MGSASEVEYLLLLSHDLGYLASPIYNQLTNEVIEIKQILTTLLKKLKS